MTFQGRIAEMGLEEEDWEEVLLSMDEMADFPGDPQSVFYVMHNEREHPNEKPIKSQDLPKYFPLEEIHSNNLDELDQEVFYMEAEGSYYPDFIEENGLTFVSLPLLKYLKEKFNLDTMEYNRIGLVSEGGKRCEEYYFILPEEVDCVIEGSISRKGMGIDYLELDTAKVGDHEIFRVKGFPHIIVTEKLNRLQYAGYECVRVENFFNYEEVRLRDYQERVTGKKLSETIEIYERKGDATGDFDQKYRMMRVFGMIKQPEFGQGIKQIFDSYAGQSWEAKRLADRTITLTWSWEHLRIEAEAGYFGENGFDIRSMNEIKELVGRLPDGLRQAGKRLCYEAVWYFLMAGCRSIFDGYDRIHGGRRMRLYFQDETSRSVNPPLLYDYRNDLQRKVEALTDLRKNRNQSGLPERDFKARLKLWWV